MVWGSNESKRSGLIPLSSLQRELNGVFDDFFSGWEIAPTARVSERLATFNPKVDVVENDREIKLTAELPGIKKEEVKLAIENGVLSLSGEKKVTEERDEGKVHRVERSYGAFFRSFTLPTEIDEDNINASYDSGVLSVTLPKSKAAKAAQKTISIR